MEYLAYPFYKKRRTSHEANKPTSQQANKPTSQQANKPTDLISLFVCSLFTLVFFSCEAEDPSDEAARSSVEESQFAIHNGINIIVDDTNNNCTPSRLNKLNRAYYFMRDAVGNPRYRQCLDDAFFAQTQHLSTPERNANIDFIRDHSNSFLLTEVHCIAPDGCGPGAIACTSGPPEVLGFEANEIDGGDPEWVAGVYMHEIMHDYSFFHSMGDGSPGSNLEYWSSVNQVASQCVYNVAKNLSDLNSGFLTYKRSALTGQIELSLTGGDDVSLPFDGRCATGRAITGFQAYVSSDNNMTGLKFYCHTVDTANDRWTNPYNSISILGDYLDSTLKGPVFCGSNEVAVAINGRSGFFIENVEMQCAPIASVESGSNTPSLTIPSPSSSGSGYGGLSGDDFSRACPNGKVLTGFRGRVDTDLPVGQLKPLCSPITDLTKNAQTIKSTLAGTTTGDPSDLRCSGSSAVMGLHGRYGYCNGLTCVHRVGIECKNFVAGNPNQLNNSQKRHISDGAGCWGGPYDPNDPNDPWWSYTFGENVSGDDICPINFVLVGFNLRHGSLIDSIQGVCVRLSAWRAWNGPPDPWDWQNDEHWLTAYGGSGGGALSLVCPYKKVMTGLYAYAKFGFEEMDDGWVYGIKIICES